MISDFAEIVVADDVDFVAANERLYALGATDGLPVVPPTNTRIDAMLGGRSPARKVATLAPRYAEATLHKIAVCAVMAGCLPEYLPVLIAATEAVADDRFNLLGVQTTTGTAATIMVVNGPLAVKLGVNSGGNALGPGVRANATLGRAMSLILRNIGGAIPGELDMATMGQPGKYTFCFAENEQENPWEPLHVSRGFARDESTVTMLSGAGTVEVRDDTCHQAQSLLSMFARIMVGSGSVGGGGMLSGGEPLVLFSPEHARIVAKDMTRAQAQAYLFEKARLPVATLPAETQEHLKGHDPESKRAYLTPALRAEDILLAVVGGVGYKSTYIPTWGGGSAAITKCIQG